MTLKTIENFRLIDGDKLDNFPADINASLAAKQATLVSGTNIKTVNSQSLLWSGNIVIAGGWAVDSVNTQTGAVVLDTWDISSVVDSRYVTDAQQTVIWNTSNTNTGDQTISDATITTTDITTNNVSTSKHWFVPKGSWVATEFLNGNGVYSTPAWGGGGVSDWFSAYVWSSASLTTSFAKVQFNTERADDGGNYDNATYTYTVPSTWWYIFTANVEIYWLTTWDNAGVSWFLNGSNIGIEQISANSRVAYSPSIIIDLTAADTMDLRVRNATASRGTISGWGASQYNFSGSKLY